MMFLRWWQLGIPWVCGTVDAIRKVRDISGVGELTERWSLLCIWQGCEDLKAGRENLLSLPQGWAVPASGQLSGCWGACITLHSNGCFHEGQSFGFAWESPGSSGWWERLSGVHCANCCFFNKGPLSFSYMFYISSWRCIRHLLPGFQVYCLSIGLALCPW